MTYAEESPIIILDLKMKLIEGIIVQLLFILLVAEAMPLFMVAF